MNTSKSNADQANSTSSFSGENGKQLAVMLAMMEADRARNPPPLIRQPTFKCHCDRLVRLEPSHYIPDATLGCHVQDVVCQGCRKDYSGVVRIICARCKAVIQTGAASYDGKLGFDFKPGSLLHVPVCQACLPDLMTLKPEPKVPIVELLIHQCAKEQKSYREEIQKWWSLLLRRLPPSTSASVSPRIENWIRKQ